MEVLVKNMREQWNGMNYEMRVQLLQSQYHDSWNAFEKDCKCDYDHICDGLKAHLERLWNVYTGEWKNKEAEEEKVLNEIRAAIAQKDITRSIDLCEKYGVSRRMWLEIRSQVELGAY